MTALFDLAAEVTDTDRAQRVLDDARADHFISQALDHARGLGGRLGLELLQTYSRKIAATESLMLAEHVEDDGDTRRAERLLNDGKTSKRERRKKANRAKVVGKNADLASKLADNVIGEEPLDVLADASTKSDGAAATDTDLIDKVAAAPPEQGKAIVDGYLADRATADGVQTEHDLQRAMRRASKFHNKNDGLDTIKIAGDAVAAKAMFDAIEARANQLYQQDGGRDLPSNKRLRTPDQRKFDAAYELICGTTSAGANNQDFASSTSKRFTPSSKSRPRIVVGLTVDKLLGRDPAAVAIQHGFGLIPDGVLAEYASDAEIFAALYDRNGEPLWLGRLARYANTTQMIALILRDKGCVLCGADHTKCQAHHSMPWNAPGKGRTDLGNLVLLCGSCHHHLHADNYTIYHDHNRIWRTRPATANETPPARPDTARNTIRRE